jgi:hypothetical protein
MVELLTEEEYRDSDKTDYFQLYQEVNAKYPKGWYVAALKGEIIADGETFEAVDEAIRAKGLNVQDVAVVQAGDENEFLWIL